MLWFAQEPKAKAKAAGKKEQPAVEVAGEKWSEREGKKRERERERARTKIVKGIRAVKAFWE